MISVIIPTLNAERDLPCTLSALIPAAIEGLVREVIVVDGGSSDQTLTIANNAGAQIVTTQKGRGQQLQTGALHARQSWLFFLHADTELKQGWEKYVINFMNKIESKNSPSKAAALRFKLCDEGWKPRVLEILVALRCALFKLPYGDQGLLIQKSLYDEIGGYNSLCIMEDVDIIRRIGRARVTLLQGEALTSAYRYKTEGYIKRTLRNQICLLLYFLGLESGQILKVYEKLNLSQS